MNVLKKNINLYIKNQQKIRSLFSVVRPKAIETSVNIDLCQRAPLQLNFYGKNIRTKYNALKIQAFQFSSDSTVSQLHYEKFCAETLDSLCDYLEELVESVNELATADVLNKVSKNVALKLLWRSPYLTFYNAPLAGWCANSKFGIQIRDICDQ